MSVRDQVDQNSQELRKETYCNWLKEFQDDKLEKTEKEKIEPKKRGRPKKKLDGKRNKRRVRDRKMKVP